ncbi:MAG TPA: hypothetical protein VFM88_09865 [Vicinamibacteria bacterium]|nr:hypothetical protein [Vicinamibacteria bacterium]
MKSSPPDARVIGLQSFYVAAAVVALLQFLRTRERRLLPLLLGLTLLAVAHHQADWFAARPWHVGAGLALLVGVFGLPPRAAGR